MIDGKSQTVCIKPYIKIECLQISPDYLFLLDKLKINACALDQASGFIHFQLLFEKKFENVRRMTDFYIQVRMKKVDVFCSKKKLDMLLLHAKSSMFDTTNIL